MNSYLIQRGRFNNRNFKKGIDSIIAFDYMGSSEFEWGALPKSLKSIRENLNDYDDYEIKLNDKIITVFFHKKDKDDVIKIIKDLSENKIHLKEYCDLSKWVNPHKCITYNCRSDFWWDIDNHFMFWKKNDDFHLKFIDVIN